MKTPTLKPPTTASTQPASAPNIKPPPRHPHLLVNIAQWDKEQLAHHEKPGRLQPDMATASGEAVRLANLYPLSRIAIFQCIGFIEVEGPAEFTFAQALAAITGLWSEPHALPLFKRWLCAPGRSPGKVVTAENVEEVLAKWKSGLLPREIVLKARESFQQWQEAQAVSKP